MDNRFVLSTTFISQNIPGHLRKLGASKSHYVSWREDTLC